MDMEMDKELYEKLLKTAQDVMDISKNTLLVNLRFLDMALSKFSYHICDKSSYFTNGELLIYNPKHVLKTYKYTDKKAPVRDYLHIVMHCVFRHMYTDPTLNRAMWDLACDIAVENVINELQLKAVDTIKVNLQKNEISKIKQKVKMLTAEKIYNYIIENLSERDAAELRGYFYADDHEIWYMSPEEIAAEFGISISGNGNQDEDGDGQGTNGRSRLNQWWKEISERMQTDLETFSKQQGDRAGGLVQNLKAVNREKYDYTSFLKKFAVLGEAMKINDDEFDYIFYTYGLQLYDNLPLVEPLEYKEVKKIKEFVIAIDTSGSVAGDIVQKFVQKTYNILKSTESFFSKINLHIIQCDAAIQEHIKITNQDEFDEYLKNMKIHGLGGTDFKPVFNLVDKLILEKEFTNLKGLIYFTDGYGDFPKQKPPYDTAFVFVDNDYNNPDVPPWAIKLVLEDSEI